MTQEYFTFEAPIKFPDPSPEQPIGLLDVEENENGFSLVFKSPNEWPIVVRRSTGERGWMIRAMRTPILSIPKFGKVTLIFERFIAIPGPAQSVFHSWDEDDWYIEERQG